MSTLAIRGGTPVVETPELRRWPVITDADKAAVLQVLERGVLSGPFAPEVTALEQEFAGYIGSKYCLTTNSGTSALHCALAALDIGPGDEVIVPAFTFVASALAVLHQNAVPVFVDIEPITLGMDPELVQRAITQRTRAIMPVHIHGTPCNMDEILAIGRRHGIPIVEDACQAHGATYRGKKAGALGLMSAFSLQSSKNLACGEGGLFLTSDESLLEKANQTRMFGENIRRSDQSTYKIERALDGNRAYDSVTMGWMYRTNEMSAALARSQLRTLDGWNQNAEKNARFLMCELGKLPGITPPIVPSDRTSCFHKFRLRFDALKMGIDAPAKKVRGALLKALEAEGVDAVLWQSQPVPGQQLFREKLGYGNNPDLYPETNRLLDSSLCLFSHTYPIASQSAEVCEAYAEAFTKVWNHLDEALDHVIDT